MLNKPSISGAAALLLLSSCTLLWFLQSFPRLSSAPQPPKMSIVHIVMFRFKPSLSPEAIKDACDRMLALKDECLHPTSNKLYIKSSIGGLNNSLENLNGGITHAFVVEFESEEDRNYYVERDPTHLAFVKSIWDIVEKAQVLDFTPGAFK